MKISDTVIFKFFLITLFFFNCLFFCTASDHDTDHAFKEIRHESEGHDSHEEHQGKNENDKHDNEKSDILESSGHDEGKHDEGKHDEGKHDEECEEEENEEYLELAEDGIRMAEIQFDSAKMRKIEKHIELSGEVGFNEDLLVHVVPRFSGIVRKVNKRLGDYVKKGEVLARVESNESLSMYDITSSLDGTIIEKHITLGEHVKDDSNVYVVADLSSVWINLSVYAKDIHNVREHLKVEISAIGTDLSDTGHFSYISPSFNEASRIATARVVLSNLSHEWRPGMFVKGEIILESSRELLTVKSSAIQILNEKSVIFMKVERNKFIPVQVVPGQSNDRWTEIIKGMHEGDEYVSNGAFELKAEIITGSLSGHAGHGH